MFDAPGPAACDGQGNMYMVLRHELLPDREENTSGPAFLTMQRIVNGKEDNQTVPLDLADRSCFGIKFVVDGTVELIFQVPVLSMPCETVCASILSILTMPSW